MRNRCLLLAAALATVATILLTGCSTTSRETTNKDGTKTASKQSSLFVQVQGFDDSIDASGAQHTSIANYSTDAQGIIATDNLLNHLLQNISGIIAASSTSTNHQGTNSPLALMLQRQEQDQNSPRQVTASRHYYRAPK
jgi:hypothetical protein